MVEILSSAPSSTSCILQIGVPDIFCKVNRLKCAENCYGFRNIKICTLKCKMFTSSPCQVPHKAASFHQPTHWNLHLQLCNSTLLNKVKEDFNSNMSFSENVFRTGSDLVMSGYPFYSLHPPPIPPTGCYTCSFSTSPSSELFASESEPCCWSKLQIKLALT